MSISESTAISEIDNITYLAQDADRAKAFYRDTLGLSVSTECGSQGAEFVLNDGTAFGVWKMDEVSFRPGGGLVFAVADVRSAVERYKVLGVPLEADGAVEETPVCFVLHQRTETAQPQ